MKKDLAVKYKSKEDAQLALRVLNKKDPSLLMSTNPLSQVSDNGHIAFQCVNAMELDALIEIIKETGGNIESINPY